MLRIRTLMQPPRWRQVRPIRRLTSFQLLTSDCVDSAKEGELVGPGGGKVLVPWAESRKRMHSGPDEYRFQGRHCKQGRGMRQLKGVSSIDGGGSVFVGRALA